MGESFSVGIQVNFAHGRSGDMNLPISILDIHRNWEEIHFFPKFRIYLYVALTTKHKKDFAQNTYCIPFSVALKKKKISLQGWRNGSAIIDYVAFPEDQS